MTLHRFFAALKRFLSGALVVMTLGWALTAIAYHLTPKTHSATATLFVTAQAKNNTDLLQGTAFTERRVASYIRVATSPDVLNPVINTLQLNTTPQELTKHLNVTAPDNTVLLDITATQPTPRQATELADETAQALAKAIRLLEHNTKTNESSVKVSIIATGKTTLTPPQPNPKLFIALALIIGAAAAASYVLLREQLDRKLRTTTDITRNIQAPILGEITNNPSFTKHPLIVTKELTTPLSESFKHLRTNLHFAEAINDDGLIILTSALTTEGTSTIAANTSLAFADHGMRVCLVDANLRKPHQHTLFDLPNTTGLTDVLHGTTTLTNATQTWRDTTLSVLTSGPIPNNPSELLGSTTMQKLLQQLTHHYDIVLVDTPAVLDVTDATILAATARNAVLVATVGKTTHEQLRTTVSQLNAVGATVSGVIVNRATRKHHTTTSTPKNNHRTTNATTTEAQQNA